MRNRMYWVFHQFAKDLHFFARQTASASGKEPMRASVECVVGCTECFTSLL